VRCVGKGVFFLGEDVGATSSIGEFLLLRDVCASLESDKAFETMKFRGQ
jgi:hypothetical protein